MSQTDPAPLAEARWLWRRIYVFAVSLGVWLLLARAVTRATPDSLPELAKALMALQALTLVLYLVAPTAQQIAGLLTYLRLRPGGAA